MNTSLRQIGVQLYERWTALWNLDLALAERIMAPQLTLRYAQAGTQAFDDVANPQALAALIAAWHRARPGLRFEAEGPPVVDLQAQGDAVEGLVARPYRVSWPDDAGVRQVRSGTDILRLEHGLIREVWSVSGGAQGRAFYPPEATRG
jgi:hypothetical protein